MATYLNQDNIIEHLHDQLEYIMSQNYDYNNIVGIFLYGSQNYGIANRNSDIDSKVIIAPPFESFCLSSQLVSTEYHYINELGQEEHIDVKDIRIYKDMLLKQNTNYVETLFTDYYILNPRYEKSFIKSFVSNQEAIAHYDKKATINSIKGQLHHALNQQPTTIKSFSAAVRLYCLLKNYLLGKPYEECLQLTGIAQIYLLQLKNDRLDIGKSQESLNKGVQDLKQKTDELIESYGEISSFRHKDIAAIVNNGTIEILKKDFEDIYYDYLTKEEFLNQLTQKEQDAYYQIIAETHGKGHIVIARLIDKYHLSRSVYNSLLNKIKEYHVGTVENAGVSGINIYITQPELLQEAKTYGYLEEGF